MSGHHPPPHWENRLQQKAETGHWSSAKWPSVRGSRRPRILAEPCPTQPTAQSSARRWRSSAVKAPSQFPTEKETEKGQISQDSLHFLPTKMEPAQFHCDTACGRSNKKNCGTPAKGNKHKPPRLSHAHFYLFLHPFHLGANFLKRRILEDKGKGTARTVIRIAS